MNIFSIWKPKGYTLVRNDGTIHNRIRGDLVPAETTVIAQDGRYFVRTGNRDVDHFELFREGHKTFEYRSD